MAGRTSPSPLPVCLPLLPFAAPAAVGLRKAAAQRCALREEGFQWAAAFSWRLGGLAVQGEKSGLIKLRVV